jgi:hypothetical protein
MDGGDLRQYLDQRIKDSQPWNEKFILKMVDCR